MSNGPRISSPLPQPPGILVVDDEPSVRRLLADYLSQKGFQCAMAQSGHEALLHLEQQDYDLVISDIRMPEINGLELLDALSERHPKVATILVTGAGDVDTAILSMKLGAYDYIVKPFDLAKLQESVLSALERRRSKLKDEGISTQLRSEILAKTVQLDSALENLRQHKEMALEALMEALGARGYETQTHSQRVQAYALRIARDFQFDPERQTDLQRAAMLHDIGKIGVPDEILLKPGKLTPEEWKVMKEHARIGYQILRQVDFLDRVAWMVLCHHERYDGQGYPQGLMGREIPLEARIFAIADAYDAMTSDRPYRKAFSINDSRAVIWENAGTQFDESVVEKFLQIPERELISIRSRYAESTPSEM